MPSQAKTKEQFKCVQSLNDVFDANWQQRNDYAGIINQLAMTSFPSDRSCNTGVSGLPCACAVTRIREWPWSSQLCLYCPLPSACLDTGDVGCYSTGRGNRAENITRKYDWGTNHQSPITVSSSCLQSDAAELAQVFSFQNKLSTEVFTFIKLCNGQCLRFTIRSWQVTSTVHTALCSVMLVSSAHILLLVILYHDPLNCFPTTQCHELSFHRILRVHQQRHVL